MEVLILADDRTGALETAGACADATGASVRVRARADGAGIGVSAGAIVVVDLATRHRESQDAQRLVEQAVTSTTTRHAHKIDSTLRGNWAHELAARVALGQRVLLVPALPALGRTCVDGTVFVHGTPVAQHMAADARSPIRSSRPAEHLVAAGVAGDSIASLHVTDVDAWIAAAAVPVAVVDASSDEDLVAIGGSWARGNDAAVVLAGTSDAIAAGVGALLPRSTPAPRLATPLPRPLLFVCGSLHAAARAQVEVLRAQSIAVVSSDDPRAVERLRDALLADGVATLVSPSPRRTPVPPAEATRVTAELTDVMATLRTTGTPLATIVVIGGDTAAGVLGDGDVLVGGLLGRGTPWLHEAAAPDGAGSSAPRIVTRAGGFGAPDDLLRML